ncbi:MAG: glycerate kinase [Verrucomicrobiota bacterium]|nr:glycerate kinase [Verrucomicrobiota bacterium]
MRILVAPDKFKGSLGATAVAENIAGGLRQVLPDAEITMQAVADGGEGTAAAICAAGNGEWDTCDVDDANGTTVGARYCTIDGGERAVLEVSEAVGLWRIAPGARDVDTASSFGVGEMLLDAAARDVREVVVGLGGSATNDGGFGLARALGFRFLDSAGEELSSVASDLVRLSRIVRAAGSLRLPRIIAAADVRNPLLGERGATRVFAQQKGARCDQVEVLENALARLADVVARDLAVDARDLSGAGAAGGLGFGLASFCGAELRAGFDVVAEAIGLAAMVDNADVVITGEGRLDAQTLEGKAPAGVARLARAAGKRVFAIVGRVVAGAEIFDDVFSLVNTGTSEADALKYTAELLRIRAAGLGRTIR